MAISRLESLKPSAIRKAVVLIFVLITFFFMAGFVRAQYGACDYSVGTFSADDQGCEQAGGTGSQSKGRLTNTGQNWRYLLFAAAGLLTGVSLLAFVILILRRSSHKQGEQGGSN